MKTHDAYALAPFVANKTYAVHVRIKRGEALLDPSSTRRLIHGPAFVVLRRWSDGGLDATIVTPYTDPMLFHPVTGATWLKPESKKS